ncbi:bifunctional adenosylcobinamide kinase/adenosylcobinamide-phosphate guanylyltransferase [Treponema sp.]|uniref:bifunctional adenosylcobinamide kinase/adenosylcobinamide-phosphate guanylyltransferase n=1 Tax=Treponema sp. TaxID=166 RepID=UPI002A803350|nr:bifunctional adenosylcobinamide kinase/adenosylcobinamide-phosphate guanylyltransferase [Treponema sp.]MDY4133624.1 bifunctional adenosylcobinamide kinase/adenosylcobinamide-phosphate guanylyltransferase [Treponema sp.]
MIHLIYGGSGSGKSAFAEKLVMELDSEKKYYLATMKVFGDEGFKRVQRHKELRAGKGFDTFEKETLGGFPSIKELVKEKNSTILIECISNLVANEMFRNDGIVHPEKVVGKIRSDFVEIKNCTENFVIVSNNVFEDGIEYDDTTKKYMKALGDINIYFASIADRITEVVCGIPVEIK